MLIRKNYNPIDLMDLHDAYMKSDEMQVRDAAKRLGISKYMLSHKWKQMGLKTKQAQKWAARK